VGNKLKRKELICAPKFVSKFGEIAHKA